MTSLTQRSIPSQSETVSPSASSGEFLKLVPTGDGCALVKSDGNVVFAALGTDARRQCLEFARGRGVLALLS